MIDLYPAAETCEAELMHIPDFDGLSYEGKDLMCQDKSRTIHPVSNLLTHESFVAPNYRTSGAASDDAARFLRSTEFLQKG